MSNSAPPNDVTEPLRTHQQEHALKYWDTLDETGQAKLSNQISEIDLGLIASLVDSKRKGGDDSESPADRAKRAEALRDVVRQPKTEADHTTWNEAAELGEQLLREGKVGAILVAGGQGTRLGFPHPKGMFKIGPVSDVTLFQIFFEQLQARSQQAGVTIPYYIMTSDATHEETESFLKEHNFFGYDPAFVTLFKQGTMPAVDDATGKLLLADPATLCTSPDGHGGILKALDKSGVLADMQRRDLEVLFYHQVDNPTGIVCEPALIGFHHQRKSEMTTKVAAKRDAAEKMGVLAVVDDKVQIIEYSDLPDEIAAETDDAGELKFWAGNMAIHVFSRQFLERVSTGVSQLPYHVAHKKVPHIDADGNAVKPETPNAFKFERFIFDALTFAENALVVEANRVREFNPVKNAEGNDSPATARQAIIELHHDWLHQASITVPDDAVVEISPLFAVDAASVAEKSGEINIDLQHVYLR